MSELQYESHVPDKRIIALQMAIEIHSVEITQGVSVDASDAVKSAEAFLKFLENLP